MSFSKLDRDGIVQEALALLNEEGLAQVSLRKIAARLDVRVSSLYWHIRDRDELLALMCEAVFRNCLEQTASADRWDEWLRNFAIALWNKQVSLRDCQKLIIVSTLDQPVKESLQDVVARQLGSFGIAHDLGGIMQMSIQALVTGWSTLVPSPESRREFDMALAVLLDGWRQRQETGD